MNTFSTWYFFHYPERKYHRVSYNLLKFPTKVNDRNKERQRLQRKIIGLSTVDDECQKCQGLCCRGDYNHFTSIDYLYRIFSEKPLSEVGPLWKPNPIGTLLRDKFKRSGKGPGGGEIPKTKCPNLESDGCKLEVEDRPVRCILMDM
jgi:hypothetical protein